MGRVKERQDPSFHGSDFSPLGISTLGRWDLNSVGASRLDEPTGRVLTEIGTIENAPGMRSNTTGIRCSSTSSRLNRGDSGLLLQGAMSGFALFFPEFTGGANQRIFEYSGNGETTATNIQYALSYTSTRFLQYSSESGSGVDSILLTTDQMKNNDWYHIGFTRSAAQTVIIYMNGFAVAQGNQVAPTGGTSATFSIGGGANSSQGANISTISSVVIYSTELTAAQVRYLSRKTLAR